MNGFLSEHISYRMTPRAHMSLFGVYGFFSFEEAPALYLSSAMFAASSGAK